MIPRIPGLYEASLSMASADLHAIASGEAQFAHPAPRGIIPDTPYPADLIPPSQFGNIIAERRGQRTPPALARTSNVSTTTLKNAEAGIRNEYPTAAKIYRALGGHALFLAFFSKDRPAPGLVAAAIVPPERLIDAPSGYFRYLREEAGLTQTRAAERLGVKLKAISWFEKEDRPTVPHTQIIVRNFALFDLQVAYCGLWDAPRQAPRRGEE